MGGWGGGRFSDSSSSAAALLSSPARVLRSPPAVQVGGLTRWSLSPEGEFSPFLCERVTLFSQPLPVDCYLLQFEFKCYVLFQKAACNTQYLITHFHSVAGGCKGNNWGNKWQIYCGNTYLSSNIFSTCGILSCTWDIWRLICLGKVFPAYHTERRDRLEQTGFSAFMAFSLNSSVHMTMSGDSTLPPCWPLHTSEVSLPPPHTEPQHTHIYHKAILYSVTGAHILSSLHMVENCRMHYFSRSILVVWEGKWCCVAEPALKARQHLQLWMLKQWSSAKLTVYTCGQITSCLFLNSSPYVRKWVVHVWVERMVDVRLEWLMSLRWVWLKTHYSRSLIQRLLLWCPSAGCVWSGCCVLA